MIFYLKHQLIRAVMPGSESLGNYGMDKNDITVYKGAETPLKIEVKRTDRKAVITDQDYLFFLNVLSHSGDTTIIRKQLEVSDARLGRLHVEISPEDIDAIQAGIYYYSISYVPNNVPDVAERLLMINNGLSHSEFRIDYRALPIKRPPYVQTLFTEIRIANDETTSRFAQVSSRLPISEAQHELTTDFDNFSGNMIIQTTTAYDPYTEESWEDYSTQLISGQPSLITILSGLDQDVKYIRVKLTAENGNEGSWKRLQFI